MKETSFKAGVEYLPSWHYLQPQVKHQLNESAATNGDYKINRVQYEFINELNP